MTNQQHSITPPAKLLQLWFEQHNDYNKGINELLIEAAQWGADQELEECIEWLKDMELVGSGDVESLLAARRPKPQSLKEQALALIDACNDPDSDHLDDNALATIRRALEQLDD